MTQAPLDLQPGPDGAAAIVVDGDETVAEILASPSFEPLVRAIGGVRVHSDGPPATAEGYRERIGGPT